MAIVLVISELGLYIKGLRFNYIEIYLCLFKFSDVLKDESIIIIIIVIIIIIIIYKGFHQHSAP
jgi:hypothetical protein